jgi:TetR/AcrR family tetracycline transcriptional repressor
MATKVRERLTRERIIDAALHVMDQDGLEAVSMRRVAREVGVEAMSLYNHVHDKDDLLDGIRVRVFSGFAFPELAGDPYENGRRVALAWRNLLKAHPSMMELLAEDHGPPQSLDALRPMEMALAVLRSMGIPEEEVVQVFHAFGGYIQGFTMMEHQMDYGKYGGEAGLAEIAQRIDAAELPCVAAALPYMTDCDLDAQFTLGLDLMLEGIRARYGPS